MDIEEMIADAKAEEEVKSSFVDTFKEQLAENLKNNDTKAFVSLEEYAQLRMATRDLDLIINSVIDNCELNYSRNGLRFKDERDFFKLFKVLYPDIYTDAFNTKKEEQDGLIRSNPKADGGADELD